MWIHTNAIAACSVLVLSLQVSAQERKIDRSSLPPAVEKTIQAHSSGATMKGFSTERDHGKTVYEAEMIVNNHTKDIEVADDGTLNEIEEEVAFDSLPKSVQNALTKKAGAAKITKVESLTKAGKLVAYEAATLNGRKTGEIQIGPTGESLAHEE